MRPCSLLNNPFPLSRTYVAAALTLTTGRALDGSALHCIGSFMSGQQAHGYCFTLDMDHQKAGFGLLHYKKPGRHYQRLISCFCVLRIRTLWSSHPVKLSNARKGSVEACNYRAHALVVGQMNSLLYREMPVHLAWSRQCICFMPLGLRHPPPPLSFCLTCKRLTLVWT